MLACNRRSVCLCHCLNADMPSVCQSILFDLFVSVPMSIKINDIVNYRLIIEMNLCNYHVLKKAFLHHVKNICCELFFVIVSFQTEFTQTHFS
jgi:hypothetical protein